MKRSNRLVLLVGVFLAIVAFVGILLLSRGGSENTPVVPTTGQVVIATSDIPLSTRIGADQVTTKTVPLAGISPGAYTDTSQVIGQIARQPVAKDAQITTAVTSAGASGTVIDVQVPAGLRAIAVRVDQTSGVGTVIKNGDYVDAIMALTEEQFASVTRDTANPGQVLVTNPGPKGTSVKLILQGMQVLGTLLPPVAQTPATQPEPSAAPSGAPPAQGGTSLNEQQQIVILAVTAQQSEVIRYGQEMQNPLLTLALILRSPDDFIDPVTHQPITPPVDTTTGIVLKSLIDKYGVLPPTILTPVLPSLAPAKP